MLSPLNLTIVSAVEAGVEHEPEETGASFAENAVIKARFISNLSGLPALADDSGLQVSALGDEPGIHSRRWAGDVSDAERNQRLLDRLADVHDADRGARFVSAVAVALPRGAYALVTGELRGVITREPRGTNGFGYDPIFLIPTIGRTLGELSTVEKNSWSHRARAIRNVMPFLQVLLARA
ncbi:MAG: RdgB/HAM1 family non-canonical purine NTP pyrophosphatase [Chloroflexi bacterium]|nr:RdgB/HAM1 family non-canonical purine NTP pyrophosphatase [Chloroflexota bacterium]